MKNIESYVGKTFKVVREELIAEQHDLVNGDTITFQSTSDGVLYSTDLTWWCLKKKEDQPFVLAPENHESTDEEYLEFLDQALEEV